MPYQGQDEVPIPVETLESKREEFEQSLKEYQEKITALGAAIESNASEEKATREKLAEAREALRLVTQAYNDMDSKRVHIMDEIDTVMINKNAEVISKKKELEDERRTASERFQELERQLKLDREAVLADQETVKVGMAALSSRESQLVVIEKSLREREIANEAKEQRLAALELEIEEQHRQADDRHALVDNREVALKVKEDQLEQEKVSLDLEQAAWRTASDEVQVKMAALADIDTALAKFDIDLAEFKIAKERMELREAALDSQEQHLRKQSQDLKQQENALMQKAKGV